MRQPLPFRFIPDNKIAYQRACVLLFPVHHKFPDNTQRGINHAADHIDDPGLIPCVRRKAPGEINCSQDKPVNYGKRSHFPVFALRFHRVIALF